MVDRLKAMNKPCWKVNNVPIFWLHEVVQSEWFCRGCKNKQKGGTVSFELTIKFKTVSIEGKPIEKPMRVYLCMDCAGRMLEESLEKVKICKEYGADGFQMLQSL